MHSVKSEFVSFDADLEGNVVVFVDETLVLSEKVQKKLGKAAQDILMRTALIEDFKGARKTAFHIPAPAGIPVERLTFIGTGNSKNSGDFDKLAGWKDLGGYVASQVKGKVISLLADFSEIEFSAEKISSLVLGFHLRLYKFDQYKTKKKPESGSEDKGREPETLIVAAAEHNAVKKAYKNDSAVLEGTLLARDLVNEPANILYPEEFAKRASVLKKLKVDIEILDGKALKKEGFGALLAVGQGSKKDSQVVIMRWQGGKESDAPIAFIGKGVCFDSGGISIKPSAGMEDMKGDMGGAACVTGLMHALASRKAKVNVVAAIGLVENMPDGSAMRPGDIVTSLSGQTIEVVNTDAEGRLVLADLLWYVQNRFNPKFMLDLATLTGAIMVALGQDYAGLFSNDERLPAQLLASGLETGERIWHMPLGAEHDKAIDSKFADMKNSAGRLAGSSTAAAFLKRYVNEVPWVHLDIAGTAMGSPKSDINTSWGSGWGVQLLDHLIRSCYEK